VLLPGEEQKLRVISSRALASPLAFGRRKLFLRFGFGIEVGTKTPEKSVRGEFMAG
jgi:hypothetical protein